MRRRTVSLLALVVALATACDTKPEGTQPTAPAAESKPTPATSGSATWRYPAARRVVAIGDVHGDLKATVEALALGKLIDGDNKWIGGDAVLVQTGDMLDRGDDEQRIVDLLHDLKEQATAAGGAVHILNATNKVIPSCL